MAQIFDQYGGVVKTIQQAKGGAIVNMHQDVNPILDDNAKRRNANVHDYTPSLLGKRVASIPHSILLNYLKAYGINAYRFMQMRRGEQMPIYKRILRDPDFAKVRTV